MGCAGRDPAMGAYASRAASFREAIESDAPASAAAAAGEAG
jgi:hypothetical protein